MRTKEMLAVAKPYMKTNGTVNYLVSMIKSYEAQLGAAVVGMKMRMDMLEQAVKGELKFSYEMRGGLGGAGSEIDVIQGQIYELACMLQVVLKNTYDIEVED